MIVKETVTIEGVELDYSYSDRGMLIENQDGVRYAEAYDPAGSGRTYVETDEKIPVREDEASEFN